MPPTQTTPVPATREALDAPSGTVADVMRWRPCYGKDRVKELFAGRTRLTALDILDLDVPVADRFWAVLRETFLPREQIVSLACDFAEHVLPLFEARYPDDKRPREAIEAARSGDKQRAREARKAADAAANAAAAYAAAYAAYAAADAAAAAAAAATYAAAAYAAYAAADAANATYAAADAAYAAADAADAANAANAAAAAYAADARKEEQDWQLARVREVLQGDAR